MSETNTVLMKIVIVAWHVMSTLT